MKNKNEIDFERLFADVNEPLYDQNFSDKVTQKINRRQRNRRILRVSLIFSGILIFASAAPWLLKQTGFIIFNITSFVNVITGIFLSPVGWVISGMVMMYSILKTRLNSQ